MNLRIPTTAISLAFFSLCPAESAEFLPISAYAHNMLGENPGGDGEMIGGPGVGFDAEEPHDKLGGGDNWYTNAQGGFPSDYISVHEGPEYIWFDLGADVTLDEISYWGYANTNSNGMREFKLSFATDAEGGEAVLGDESYGTSITANPSFTAVQEETPRQSFEFPEVVTARYVRLEALSTFYNQPGAGAGGDRLGIGDIAFQVSDAAPGNDLVVTEIDLVGEDVVLTFKSKTGRSYSLWRTTDLMTPLDDWEELNDSFPSGGNFTTFTDNNLPEGALRMFYQVRPAL
jgi:hypothetical protein